MEQATEELERSSVRYVSTRGVAPVLEFDDVLLTGLARDGGLYVPQTLPQLDLAGLQGLSYAELAARVLGLSLIHI